MRKSSHVQYDIEYHIVWATKYRYDILTGRVATRAREIIRQSCSAMNVEIVKGSIGKTYVHLFVSCPPNLSVSKLVQQLKGKTSKILQSEYKEVQNRYWGNHLWASGYFCKSVGHIVSDDVKNYVDNIIE